LAGILERAGIEYRLLAGTRDIWVRDFMPVQFARDDFVLFRYEPGYLCGYEDLVTPDEVRRAAVEGSRLRGSDINLDGGNVVAARDKVILTEKVFGENAGRSRAELRRELERLFQAECVFIPVEPGDKIGHADGVVRFIDDDRVVINDYSRTDSEYGERLIRALGRHHLHIDALPYSAVARPRRIGIDSAVGNHVNFLRIGRLVVVPVYDLPQDGEAVRRLADYLAPSTVIPLHVAALAEEGGVLNCVSWCVR
jgi:agmatine deiminase